MDLVNTHQHYHAHVYFDESSQHIASELRDKISDELNMPVGRFHTKLVGPHTMWSFMIAFNTDQFDTFTQWLNVHRQDLSILIHADTGDDYADHTQHVNWLGSPVDIDLSKF
ncbi:DOPA 4,5-dioxygenase family protein [Vibrio sp. S4M6]|uniref:DOPA 4,5-dioxygenase family protein n=1 Tax=Vibrio sinus TaxID=2946865 RepID=UPI00202A491E|nr:DOPA 4,5-dioxygenase family protein [Vibrio sinus]MCL9782430.1 DOPA 4,5-dioxygenase family protein [Vibrio sinus]